MIDDYRKLCLEDSSDRVKEGVGKNIIPPPKEKPLWIGFIEKFKDPVIVVLLVVFMLSVGISLYEIIGTGKSWSTMVEPLGILVALLLATGVGFIFEVRAEKEFKILNRKKDERKVKVLRWIGGNVRKEVRPQLLQIKKSDVVVGDIVRLESGDEVPADGKIVKSETLRVDESAFTGEMYANKSKEYDSEEESAYPRDFLLRGSIVLEGQCLYQVTAVGMDTEEGKGAKIIQEKTTIKTPLNEQLDNLGKWITRASYLIAALIVVGRLIYFFAFDGNQTNDADIIEILSFTLNSIMIAVTLIVVAVPEGLPMSVTISLALSMKKMLKENSLVRKLHACETMGAATVICTDKTGTLTENKLRVMEDSEVLYDDIEHIARGIAVNSTAELSILPNGEMRSVGNPTECSLLHWLHEVKGIDYQDFREVMTIVHQETFSSDTKQMTTYAIDNLSGEKYKFVKGAPEVVLAMCDEVMSGRSKEEVVERLSELQRLGRRTLAFAEQVIVDGLDTPLTFLGFVGMADPVRSDVREAVEVCQKAGVNVIMVTGDVALTAKKVAEDTGIISEQSQEGLYSGIEFESLSDQEIKECVLPSLRVLSRAKPADKARLVTLLQEEGQVVAVTGDGTNDAPALKRAQVGLSMGDGTSRAKEASDITIIDNSFATINKAILWGRSLYLNIKRFILFQMTINVCACLIVLIGAFMGLDSPLNVTQMLWVNLIMDTFAAMALSSLPPDSRVMNAPPRKANSHIIDRKMTQSILGVGGFLSLFLFGLWQLLWHCDIHNVGDLLSRDVWDVYLINFFDFTKTKQHLSSYELGIFFTFFVLLQFWNLFNARYFKTERSLLLDLYGVIRKPYNIAKYYSTGFILIVFAIVVGQVLIVNVFGDMFGVSALSGSDWLLLLLLTSPILIIGELTRGIQLLWTYFFIRKR
ncbi:MAG: calcium-translocating P-type ATPase, PMCA-type [Bacteroidales bacterium]|nr:calcium-translocating P-type ATPase, PMCA-type [Bacteroidales bacterium]